MASEHEIPQSSTSSAARTDLRARAKREVREGLVVAVSAMFRAGDAVSSATARPRHAARTLVSGALTRAGHVAQDARSMVRRAREAAERLESSVESEDAAVQASSGEPATGGAPLPAKDRKKKKQKKGKRS